MDGEEDTKKCSNCKREIPASNFTIHSVHCARNIKVCPVCKEPVPGAELQEHHDKLHKLLPCKQCGESVCGTDLEDHIRDSCANTIKSCRYCELELARRELPAHEAYCGVRTERCAECGEWVMAKYRVLHLDSNHGFLRLDDDPAPPKKEPAKNLRPQRNVPTTSNGTRTIFDNLVLRPNGPSDLEPRLPANIGSRPGQRPTNLDITNLGQRPSNLDIAPTNNIAPNNVSNHKPSNIDQNRAGTSGLNGGSHKTENSLKKRLNEGSNGSGSSSNNVPAANVARAQSGVKKRTNDQPQINTDTSATKNVDKDLARSRGAIKKRSAPPPPPSAARDLPYYSALRRQQREERERAEQNAYNAAHGLPPVLSPAAKLDKLRKLDAMQSEEAAREYRRERDGRRGAGDTHSARDEFKNLKPMSPEQFMARFTAMQLGAPPPHNHAHNTHTNNTQTNNTQPNNTQDTHDRFSQIKTSLTELRRGLNQVTAPYNNTNNNNSGRGEERLPCEFCNMLLHPDHLVLHQTGCRPDLARLSPPESSARGRGPSPARAARSDPHEALIPCEFCAQALPLYLITEHQERCIEQQDYSPD